MNIICLLYCSDGKYRRIFVVEHKYNDLGAYKLSVAYNLNLRFVVLAKNVCRPMYG